MQSPDTFTPALSSAAPVREALTRGFYLGLVVLMSLIVLAGFWPFYAALLTGTSQGSGLLYLHAAVFSGWLGLLFVQAWLVYARRVPIHREVGRYGIYYGVLVLLVGAAVTISEPVRGVVDGRWSLDEAAGFMILPLGDILLFAGFFAAGIAFRRRKDLHKRLMVLATIALIFPGAARALFEPAGPGGVLALWLLPLALAIAYDRYTVGKVAPVYWVGLGVFLVAFARLPLMESEVWLRIARPLIAPFV